MTSHYTSKRSVSFFCTIVLFTGCLSLLFLPESHGSGLVMGGYHGCQLRQSGVYCWGGSPLGASGRDNLTAIPAAMQALNFSVSDPVNFISAGHESSCVVFPDRAKCWGGDFYGQNGLSQNSSCCTTADDLKTAPWSDLASPDARTGALAIQLRQLYSFNSHRCAVYFRADSQDLPQARCWGKDEGTEQLGFFPVGMKNPIKSAGDDIGYGDEPGEMSTIPFLEFSDTFNVVMLAGGNSHTCAMFSNFQVRCWGDHSKGQTGLATRAGYKSPVMGDNTRRTAIRPTNLYTGTSLSELPYLVFADTLPIHSIAAGGDVTCALFFNNALITKRRMRCWGDNTYGQLGRDNTISLGSAPTDLPNLPFITFRTTSEIGNIAVGDNHVCAVFIGGVRCWGDNRAGQCGRDTAEPAYGVSTALQNSITILNFISFQDVKRPAHVSAAGNVTCVLFDYLANDNRVKCFGQNDRGQLGLEFPDDYDNIGDEFGEVKTLNFMRFEDGGLNIVHHMSPVGYLASGGGKVRINTPSIHSVQTLLLCRFTDATTGARAVTSATRISSVELECDQPNWKPNMGSALTSELNLDVTRAVGQFTSTHLKLKVFADITDMVLSPQGGPVSGGTRVTMQGTNIVHIQEPVLCRFGTNTATIVKGTVTGGALYCDPTLKNPNGTIPEEVDFYFTLNGQDWVQGPKFTLYTLVFSGFAPASGPVTGNTLAQLSGSPPLVETGDNIILEMSDGVTPSHNLSASFTPAGNRIQFTTPDVSQYQEQLALPHPFNLRVSINGGQHWDDIPFKFNYFAAPRVQRIVPNSAPLKAAGPRENIVLYGSNFSPLSGIIVRFFFSDGTSKDATGVFDEPTGTIVAQPPDSDSSGEAYIELSLNAGVAFTTDRVRFWYFSPNGLAPTGGPITGSKQRIKVAGVGYVPSSTTKCRFGTYVVPASYISGTEVRCFPPAVASPGIVPVSVSIDGVQFSNSTVVYTYYSVFEVTKIYPDRGPATASGEITTTISGLSFTQLQRPPLCRTGINIGQARFEDYDPATGAANITCKVKPDIGAVPLSLALNQADFQETGQLFTFVQIFSVLPAQAPSTGGSEVLLSGTGFKQSGKSKCLFDTTSVEAIVVSSAQVRCVAPQHAPGAVTVEFIHDEDAGIPYTKNNVPFRYFETPFVTKLEPKAVPSVGGTQVTVHGKHFFATAGVKCRFGRTQTLGSPLSIDNEIVVLCISPPDTLTIDVEVTFNDGFAWTSDGVTLTYYYVNAIDPTFGPTAGGTLITVAGSGFRDDMMMDAYCRFDSDDNGNATAARLDNNRITCLSPPIDNATVVSLTYTATAGQHWTTTNAPYLYYQNPSITMISPDTGPGNDYNIKQIITILGSGFFPASGIQCKFGNVLSPKAVYVDTNTITCQAPASQGVVPLAVTMNKYNWIEAGEFLYYSVAQVQPQIGPGTGGTVVTVLGDGFRDLKENKTYCRIGDHYSKATVLQVNRLTCVLPGNGEVPRPPPYLNLNISRCPFAVNPVPPVTGNSSEVVPPTVAINGTDYPLFRIRVYQSALCRGDDLTENLFGRKIKVFPVDKCFNEDPFPRNSAMKATCSPDKQSLTITDFNECDCSGEPVDSIPGTKLVLQKDKGLCQLMDPARNEHVQFDDWPCVEANTTTDGNSTVSTLLLSVNELRGVASPSSNSPAQVKPPQLPEPSRVSSRSERHQYPTAVYTIMQKTMNGSVYSSNVTVEITMNGNDYARPQTDLGVFKYYPAPAVTAVLPDRGELAGGDLITVFGDSFINSSLLACQFGPCQPGVSKCSKEAVFVNDTTLTCYSPPHGAGQIVVEVSNNDQQFHPGAIYEYEVCKAGWFSKTLASSCIKCPNGTFSSQRASLECRRCSETSYTLNEATVQCTECPANTHIPGDSRQSRLECQCREGFYHPGGQRGEACVPCPNGAECAGDIIPPSAIDGYWGSPDVAFVFMACDIPEACPGGPPDECNAGYGGRFCARCTPGYYQLNKFCEVCPDLAEWILVMFGVFAVLVVIFLVKMVGMNASAYGGTIGLATQFFQTIGLINKLNLKWPESLRVIFEYITGPFTFSIDILATECSFPVSYRSKWVSTLLMPLYFGFLFVAVYVGANLENSYKRKKHEEDVERHQLRVENPDDFSSLSSWELDSDFEVPEPKLNDAKSLKNRMINAYFLFLSLVFLVIILTSLEIFDCTDRGDQRFTLDVHPALICYDTAWWIMLPLGIAGSFGYGIVVPTLFVTTVVRNTHRLNTPQFIERYGSVYSEYSTEWPWWEGVVMAQKLALALPVLYFNRYAEFQVVAFLFILFLGLSINLIVRPYYIERYNKLQDVLRWCVIVILMCGMVFRRGSFPHWSAEYFTITLAVGFIGCACVFIIMVVFGDLVVTNVSLRKNVEAAELGCLHKLMHAHGKSEIMYWLGSARAGRNYQADLCQILNAIAEDFDEHKDAEAGTELDMSPMDTFINVYTGGTFMTPVVPFVRYWLLSRISQVEADDFFSTFARSEVETFVGCFAEFNNFQRLQNEGRKVARNAVIIEDDVDEGLQPIGNDTLDEGGQDTGLGDIELQNLGGEVDVDDDKKDDDQELVPVRRTTARELRDLKDLLRTLFLDLLSDKARKRLLDQLEEEDQQALPYLMSLVVNRNDMLTYKMDNIDFHKQRSIEYLLREHDRFNSKQPLVPYLHMLYENNFTDSAMYALGNLIESTEPDPNRDFKIDKRQPVWLIQQLFVSTRLLGAEYSVFRKAKIKKAPTEKRKGTFSRFGSALTTWFKPPEVPKKESKFFFSTGDTTDSEEEEEQGWFESANTGIGGLAGMISMQDMTDTNQQPPAEDGEGSDGSDGDAGDNHGQSDMPGLTADAEDAA